MAQTIKLKRSATSGATPTTSQLELGEVAINTYDGKMYIKKNVGGTESIVEVGGLSSVSLGGISDVTISSAAADQLLQYNGSEWVNVSLAEASAIMKEYQFTATSGQTTFSGSDDNSETLSYTAGAIQVFLNGIFLDSAVDYTATNGTSIVLSETVDSNDYLQVVAFKKKIGDGSVSVDTFTGNGSTTAFTLSVDPGDENNTRVFVDGVYQSKSNYSVSGTTLTFSTAPPADTAVEVEIGNRVVTLDTLSNLDLPDNVQLRLGTGQDLKLYHTGSHGLITNSTGDIRYQSNTRHVFSDVGFNETHAIFNDNGAVQLYHDNSVKFATTSSGISVTGNIANTSGDMTLDVIGDIILDADGGDIRLADSGTQFGKLSNNGTDLVIESLVSNRDIVFKGADGSSVINALILDMSDGGGAHFNNDIYLSDNRAARFGDQQDFRIYNDGSHTTLINATMNQDIIFKGNDDGNIITALTLDMSNSGKATFSGIVNSAIGFERGNLFITQNEIDVSSGSLTLDVADRIILDASTDGDVRLHDDGLFYGQLFHSGNNLYIRSRISDGDIIFNGQDGSSFIDALRLDMSDVGTAHFNGHIRLGDNRTASFGAGYDIEITSDGTNGTISAPNGNLTLDVAGDIITSADINFGDSDKAVFGAGSDLQIYHNGTNSIIDNTGTGSLIIQDTDGTGDILIRPKSGQTAIAAYNDNTVELGYAGSVKLATTSTGINVTGLVESDEALIAAGTGTDAIQTLRMGSGSGGANKASINFQNSASSEIFSLDFNNSTGTFDVSGDLGGLALSVTRAGDISFYEDTGTAAKLTWDASAESLNFPDNGKAVFGAGNDFEIYSDGTNGVLKNTNSNYILLDSDNLAIRSQAGSNRVIVNSSGINVTGSVVSDGLTVESGAANIGIVTKSTDQFAFIGFEDNTSSASSVYVGADGNDFIARANSLTRFRAASNGDISFYEDTGTTPKFFWDASEEKLGIGTTTATAALTVNHALPSGHAIAEFRSTGNTTSSVVVRADGTGDSNIQFSLNGVTPFAIGVDNSDGDKFKISDSYQLGTNDRFVIDGSSGNVGIGTSSPAGALHIHGGPYGEQFISSSNSAMRFVSTGGVNYIQSGTATSSSSAADLIFTNVGGSGETMRIDSGGRVGIGQTPLSNNFSLQVTGLGGGSGDARAVYLKGSGAHTSIGSTGPTLVLQNTNSTVNNIVKLSFESASSGETVSINAINTNHSSHYGDMAFNTRGSSGYSEKMRIMANGNVGIGTTNPTHKLHVNSTIFIENDGSTGYTHSRLITQSDHSSRGSGLFMHNDSSDTEWYAGRPYNSSDTFVINRLATASHDDATAAPEKTLFRIYNSGTTQINARGLNAISHNFSYNESGGEIDLYNSAGNIGTLIDDAHGDSRFLQLVNGGHVLVGLGSGNTTGSILFMKAGYSEAMRIDSNGNVGIAQSSPSSYYAKNLVVGGGTAEEGITIRGSSSGRSYLMFADGTSGNEQYRGYFSYHHGTDSMEFASGATTHMTLDSSGNLLVGTTDTNVFNNSSGSGINLRASGEVQIAVDSGETLYLNRMGTDGRVINFRKAGAFVAGIDVTSTTVTYNTSSDQRLKDNIVDAPSASDDIDAIQVRSFDWKADGSHQKYGMVAQELQSVAPEAVTAPEDPEEMMGVDYSKLVPMLVKALQESRQEINNLKSRVEELESQ